MKPFRSTLVLLLAVAGLTLFFWLTRNGKGTDEAEKAKGKLFDFQSEAVTTLKVRGADGAFSLERKGGKDGEWRLTEPVQAEAEREAVLAILGELEFLQPRRTITADQIPDGDKSLAEWGLAPGNARIDFTGDGFSGTLVVGRKAAIDSLYYARTNGKDAYLIAATSRDTLFKKLDDVRSRAVIHAEALTIDQCGLRQKAVLPADGKVAFAAPAPAPASDAPSEFQIAKVKDDEWRVEKPLTAPASAVRVTAWLRQLDALRVKQFISDDAADLTAYGLTAPAAQFWIRRMAPATAKATAAAPAPEPETLLIGIPVPGIPNEVYAKRAGENGVFTLPADSVAKLLNDLPDARDRHVLAFKAADTVAVRIELPKPSTSGSLSVVEVKKDSKTAAWTFGDATTGGAAGKEADAGQVNGFLGELSALEAPKIIRDTASDLRPYGLDKPSIRLVVTVKKGEGTEDLVLSLGKTEKVGALQLLYANNSAQPFVYGLDLGFLTRFPREAWKWRSAQVFGSDLKEDQITAVTRALPGHPPETVKRLGTAFSAENGVPLQQDGAKALWAKLATLSAVHWVGAPVPAYGLGSTAARITLSLGTDGTKRSLLLGAAVAATPTGGRAAQIEGESDAFLISEADYALLTGSIAGGSGTPAAATSSVP